MLYYNIIINWALLGLIGFMFADILVYRYLWNITMLNKTYPLKYFVIFSIILGYFAFLLHLLIILLYYPYKK
jgi:hypothetical protein